MPIKRQDILAILAHVSRSAVGREKLLQVLGSEVTDADHIVEHLLQEEMLTSQNGVLAITEKGLKRASRFHGKPSHRGAEKKKPAKRRGLIQIAVLQLLKEEARHGYEVMKLLEERSEGVYVPSAGTIYPALQDLLERNLISIDEHADKKVYALTEEGLRFLAETVQETDEAFWEEWRLRMMWKQSKEAVLLREEMEKFQLEFQYAVRKVLHDPSLASELAEIIKGGRARLVQWSEEKRDSR